MIYNIFYTNKYSSLYNPMVRRYILVRSPNFGPLRKFLDKNKNGTERSLKYVDTFGFNLIQSLSKNFTVRYPHFKLNKRI